MTSAEIRNSYLSFFEERGHKILPSTPVIPYDDPTLLFTNAGMNQFKDLFLGTGKRGYLRAANAQKCIRVSGKHNDLEEVGRDTYHHTFFEMLGNWSFGDYYKKEAIGWAWELLTKIWGLEKKRLYSTVFESDDEAEELWKNETDIEISHILRFGRKDNFWEMGETGPCGPCSEIHIDLTDDHSGSGLVNKGDPRVIEIWNLVFIQYNRDDKGTLALLPAKHVDTGMGFERICAVLQQKKSNYDTDLFAPIISRISDIAAKPYKAGLLNPVDIAMRVVSDHVRMLSCSIADGGVPSNEGRGYVIRRILRRAARFGRNLGMHEPFIYKIVETFADTIGSHYPEIKNKQNHIERVIKGEEESFNSTLDRGLEIFKSVIQQIGDFKTFPGEAAFKLYDTYGFPLDLTEMMAAENGLNVDSVRFEELMKEQKERSRSIGKLTSDEYQTEDYQNLFSGIKKFSFVYDLNETEIKTPDEIEFFKIYSADKKANYFFVLQKPTPFYPELGGQIGDTGFVFVKNRIYNIIDTKKESDFIAHYVDPLTWNELREFANDGKKMKLQIDTSRRLNVMRNHTATHLLHEALRQVLGEHLHQQGSLVAPDRLRFDFNHFEKITTGQLKAVEKIVNEKISEEIPVIALNNPHEWLTIDEAKRRYPRLKMYFGEKYGEKVRVVEIKNFTWELCGGTHVKNTRDIGIFKIISESGIASGIRRIEAVTGEGFRQHIEKMVQKITEMDVQIEKLVAEKKEFEKRIGGYESSLQPTLVKITLPSGTIAPEVIENVEGAIAEREIVTGQLSERIADFKKELSKYRLRDASLDLETIVANAHKIDGIRIVKGQINVENMEELQNLGDILRLKLGSGVGVLGAVFNEKVSLVCVVTDDLIKNKKLAAGKIVNEVAKIVKGGGGGRPHLATAGGKDISKLTDALDQTEPIVLKMLSH